MAGKGAGSGGGGVSGGAIRAGEAFVELVVKDNAFYRGISRARRALSDVGGHLRQVGALTFAGGVVGLTAIAALFKRIHETKAGLNADEAERLGEAGEMVESAWQNVEGLFGRIVAAILPTREEMAELFRVVSLYIGVARDWIDQNQGLVQTLALGVAVITGAGAAAVALGVAASGASLAIGGIIIVAKGVVAAVGLLATPLGAAAAALGVIGYLFVTQTETGQRWKDSVIGYFSETAETFKTAWSGIGAALSKGDLALAGKIALAALNVEFRRAIVELQKAWNGFKAFFLDAWDDAVYLVKVTFSGWESSVSQTTVSAIGKLKEEYTQYFNWLAEQGAKVAEMFGDDQFALNLRKLAGASVQEIKDAVVEAKKSLTREQSVEEKRLRDEADKKKAGRDEADKAKILELEGAVAAAKQELAALAQQAQNAAAPGAEIAPAPRAMQRIGDAVRGTSNLRLASQIFGGGSNLADQAAKAQVKVPVLLGQVVGELKGVQKAIDRNRLAVT